VGEYTTQLFQTSRCNVQVTCREHSWRLAITTYTTFLGYCLEPWHVALQPVGFRFEAL
jgi:hypothetical protein